MDELPAYGMAALFLAAKLDAEYTEDTDTDRMEAIVPIVTRQTFKDAERDILGVLGFDLWINHPYRLLDDLRHHLGIRCENCRSLEINT